MIVKLLFLDKAFGATGALVWFNHVVLGHVDLQVFPSVELLRAYVA